MIYKFLILLALSVFVLACSQDESETIYAPHQQDSFLNGEWKGLANEEQKTLNLDVNLKENYGSISGNGTVKMTVSDDINDLSLEFSGSFSQGVLNGSQISFVMESSIDSDYVAYNGGLDKTDSSKFNGNASYYLSSQHRSIRFVMTLNKQ
ncbi:MAG: hypothetical protein GXO87_07385 [Chlorobi bacterium]|nr:hypothetical protein [Chlorobiota bacterium]